MTELASAQILPMTRIPIPLALRERLTDCFDEIQTAVKCREFDDLLNAVESLRIAVLIVCTEVYR